MQSVKVVLVGGGTAEVMKELVLTLCPVSQEYQNNPVPTSVDTVPLEALSVYVQIDGKSYTMCFWPTHPGEEYDRLRPLSYPRTDLFAVAYNPHDERSFDLVETKWIPEVSHHCPNTPIAVIELRPEHPGDDKPVVTEAQGQELARKLEAIGWFSYRTAGVNTQFARDLLEALVAKWHQQNKKNKSARCVVS